MTFTQEINDGWAIIVLALLLSMAVCTNVGAVARAETLIDIDWSGADDAFSPLPSGWQMTAGEDSVLSLVRGVLSESGSVLRMANSAGAPSILTVPIDLSTVSGTFFVELEAGVEEVTQGDAIFFMFGGIIDFRLSSRGIPTLMTADKNRILLGDESTYEPGTLLRLKLELNPITKTVDRVWINGQQVPDFIGINWLKNTVGSNFQLIATTGSSGDIYWKRIVVTAGLNPLDQIDDDPFDVETLETIIDLNWFDADDVFSILPTGWEVRQGSLSNFALEYTVLGEDGPFFVIKNEVGQPRIFHIPIEGMPASGLFFLELEFGVDTFQGGGDAIYATFPGVLDLRVNSGTGLLSLVDADKRRTSLYTYNPGQFISVRIELDIDSREVRRIWINDELIEGFSGMPWLHSSPSPAIQLIATTPSGADIYWKRVKVMAPEGFSIEDGGSPNEDTIPSIGPLITPDVDLIKDRERLQRALDLSIDDMWLERDFPTELFLTREQVKAISDLIETNPRAAASWSGIKKSINDLLLRGTFLPGDRPYIYTVMGELPKMAFAYLLTGNDRLGELIRVVALDAANRPMSFWIHDDLRPYNPLRPVGALETATLARGMAMVLNWASDVFTPGEQSTVRNSLVEKGLVPSIRWLDQNRGTNNWRAVMSVGAFITAKVLSDFDAMTLAEQHIREYLHSVEDDGSYGEQIAYFSYGIRSLIPGLIALDQEEAKKIVKDSGLGESLYWSPYYYGFIEGSDERFLAGRINFGDDDFPTRPDLTTTYFLANATDNGLGTWLIDKYFDDDHGGDWVMLVLLGMFQGESPEPVDPETLQMETMRAFDNGVGVIRSSWNPNGVVLGIRSGGASRTGYAHDRPDRNSILMYVGGEYMLVAPGRASYRSPLRSSWDLKTSSHNTITFGGNDQLRASDAEIITTKSGDLVDYMVSDAARSYSNTPEKVRRHIVYVKDPGYFFIWDEMKLSGGDTSPVDWHLHMNNVDGKGILKQVTDDEWSFSRPNASLYMYVASSISADKFVENGIMHRGYSYYPGDANEGRMGSSIKLRMTTTDAVNNVSFYTVLQPITGPKDEDPAFEKSFDEGSTTITVDYGEFKDSFIFVSDASSGKWPPVAVGNIIFQRKSGEDVIVCDVLRTDGHR